MIARQHVTRGAIVAGAAVTLLGAVLPWLRSGTRLRTSFELFGLVDRLGIGQGSVVAWAVRLWPVVPLLLVAAVVAAAYRRRWETVALASAAAVYAGGVAVALLRVTDSSLIAIESGPVVTLVGAAVLLLGSILAAAASAASTQGEHKSPHPSRIVT